MPCGVFKVMQVLTAGQCVNDYVVVVVVVVYTFMAPCRLHIFSTYVQKERSTQHIHALNAHGYT